ncbi:FeoA family protein [Pseudodesulfovibrio piezophilus]|uniref:FeoA family protein n=1 Tax=Pseudodesulfovibrio piezophilus TaxID=879567 RepID=UPI0009FECACE|nr:FeoA family protein [Pseudodesulfovibrio piezophilus]
MTTKPLSSYPQGSTVRIANIQGGQKARSRMLAMGMTPGCPIQVLAEDSNGYKVRVRGADIVLCCRMASKIMAVESSESDLTCSCCPNPHSKAS